MGEQHFGIRSKPGEAIAVSAPLVNAVATALVAAYATPNRISVEVQNKSTSLVYVGTTNLVTAANGIALDPASGANLGDGGVCQIDVGPEEAVWAIANVAPARVHVTELLG